MQSNGTVYWRPISDLRMRIPEKIDGLNKDTDQPLPKEVDVINKGNRHNLETLAITCNTINIKHI